MYHVNKYHALLTIHCAVCFICNSNHIDKSLFPINANTCFLYMQIPFVLELLLEPQTGVTWVSLWISFQGSKWRSRGDSLRKKEKRSTSDDKLWLTLPRRVLSHLVVWALYLKLPLSAVVISIPPTDVAWAGSVHSHSRACLDSCRINFGSS